MLVAIVLLFAAVAVVRAESRVALVIGNSAYVHTAPLKNPRNDAQAVAEKLTGLGFEVVRGYDLDHRETLDMLRDFGSAAKGSDVAVLYYAGHAVQVKGQNYLVPVDVRLKTARDLKFEGVPLSWYMEELGQAGRLRIAILDACRDNPLAQVMARSMGTRSSAVGRGLARVDTTTSDTLIAYATRANAVAEDGTGDHSPYTTALLANIDTPGLDVRLMFGSVRDAVRKATNGRQEPFVYGSVGGEIWSFNPQKRIAETARPKPDPRPQSRPRSSASALEYWNLIQIQDSGNAAAYRAFIEHFDDPVLMVLAEAKLKELDAATKKNETPSTDQSTRPADPPEVTHTEMAPTSALEWRAAEAALARVSEIPPHIIQYALHELGHYKGALDGLIGPGSRRAIRAFQQARGYAVTGKLENRQTVSLIQFAAKAGYPHSQNVLGMMAASGVGVVQDEAAAKRWFEASAAQGNAYAAYNLGLLYRDGRGVAKSVERARTYFEQARAGGYAQAVVALKSLGEGGP